MLPWSTTIFHRHLKMSMVDGLVERLCEFLYGIVVLFAKHEFPKYYNEQGVTIYMRMHAEKTSLHSQMCASRSMGIGSSIGVQ